MEKRLEEPLKIAVGILEKNGYRYAVIGGLALARWGRPRITKDVDIKVLVPDLDYQKIRSLLTSSFPKTARLQAPTNPFIVARIIGDIIVDFLLAIPGYEERIIERAVEHDIGGWKVWICSAEDLIIQKMVANREKDFEDVQYILVQQHGRLDTVYINMWLTQFADALERPEILKRYQILVENAKNIVRGNK